MVQTPDVLGGNRLVGHNCWKRPTLPFAPNKCQAVVLVYTTLVHIGGCSWSEPSSETSGSARDSCCAPDSSSNSFERGTIVANTGLASCILLGNSRSFGWIMLDSGLPIATCLCQTPRSKTRWARPKSTMVVVVAVASTCEAEMEMRSSHQSIPQYT